MAAVDTNEQCFLWLSILFIYKNIYLQRWWCRLFIF